MKKQTLNRLIPGVLSLLAVAVMSSCNRGYGCPTNFSVDESVQLLIQQLLNVL
jgi:hypothetical protein